MIGAIVVARIAATPQKPAPYNVNWYLHPQQLVDIGGRRLNIVCTGKGSPTVILEAGLMADSSAWRYVQPAVSRTTRVCAYDRAGLGFSDPADAPRDAAAIVDDLHSLLRRAGIAPPYVLVGWSSGGPYTRLYQYRYPKDVDGLVQVDPDTEFYTLDGWSKILMTVMHKPQQWIDQQMREWYGQYDSCAVNVLRGTCALFPGGLAKYRHDQRAAGCPQKSRTECALAEVEGEHLDRPGFWKDEARELEASDESAAEVLAAARPYRKLPLIVLTDSERGDVDSSDVAWVAAQRAGWVAKDKAAERVARLSTVGAHFVVANSTHDIPLDHPNAVISAIDEVVSQARLELSAGASKGF